MLLFGISIHAPRTGSDKWLTFISCKNFDFNPRSPHGERRYPWTSLTEAEIISIHAPRTGSDDLMDKRFKAAKKFQSTLPARGATAQPKYIPRSRRDFNPRSPHGERRHGEQKNMRHRMISIHAPRTGSDGNADEMTAASRISIHAPRTGSDRHRLELLRPHGDFNPRSPHGERPARAVRRRLTGHFNPRSPHGERPAGSIQHILHRTISIHAPRTGSDSLLQQNGRTGRHFNPRSPHGERLPNEAIQKMP